MRDLERRNCRGSLQVLLCDATSLLQECQNKLWTASFTNSDSPKLRSGFSFGTPRSYAADCELHGPQIR